MQQQGGTAVGRASHTQHCSSCSHLRAVCVVEVLHRATPSLADMRGKARQASGLQACTGNQPSLGQGEPQLHTSAEREQAWSQELLFPVGLSWLTTASTPQDPMQDQTQSSGACSPLPANQAAKERPRCQSDSAGARPDTHSPARCLVLQLNTVLEHMDFRTG